MLISSLGILLATSPAMANYTIEWHSRTNGHLKMWWTKNGIRITEYPFIDNDVLHPIKMYFIAPHKDINDSHEQWVREGKTKTSLTSAVAGLSYDFPTFEDYFMAQGTESVSWFDLSDNADMFDVEVVVDLVAWGDYLRFNPMPDPDILFLFDAGGQCAILPGYVAFEAGTGSPFTGEMTVEGITTLYAEAMPGDANCDRFVGSDDLVRILTNWGANGPDVGWDMGDVAPYPDGDDFIGADDYVEVLTQWGSGAPLEVIPEPAALILLGIGASAMLGKRR